MRELVKEEMKWSNRKGLHEEEPRSLIHHLIFMSECAFSSVAFSSLA